MKASVVNRSGPNLLIDIADHGELEQLKSTLPGWSFFPQGQKIPLPDTRLKIGGPPD